MQLRADRSKYIIHGTLRYLERKLGVGRGNSEPETPLLTSGCHFTMDSKGVDEMGMQNLWVPSISNGMDNTGVFLHGSVTVEGVVKRR